MMNAPPSSFPGLDMLVTAVLLLDERLAVRYANPAALDLFALGSRALVGRTLREVFQDNDVLSGAVDYARFRHGSYTEHDLLLGAPGHPKAHLNCSITPGELVGEEVLLVEFRPIDQELKIAREERMLDQSSANRELIRNLAHEIKNPLGGIRGAAQLLDHELDRPDLHEYTQVIIKEADRLQALMDRLLTPHRLPQRAETNIHEVLERVRSLVLAEMDEIIVRRDYDTSLPPLVGDREQLIQAVLNVARNAAQAMKGKGTIVFRTRIARQVTLHKKRHRHAICVQIVDDGPGIPPQIRERVFYPLVTGREGGSGLGLTLAQQFVNQHGGAIEFESEPGRTIFTLLLPLVESRTDSRNS